MDKEKPKGIHDVKLIIVSGARPNFVKIAPLIKAIERHNKNPENPVLLDPVIVHTGQHYDEEMSRLFFRDLSIPKPDYDLNIGSGSHGEQTGRIMIAFEPVVKKEQPHLVVVVGDVNSTLACALVASKLNIPVAHIEAGLRSFDRTMPEEINRILTDQISDYLFTHSRDANENLIKEGIPEEKIFFVGNIMIDSLKMILNHTEKSTVNELIAKILVHRNLRADRYAILTLHRPSNVDDKRSLRNLLECLHEISKEIPIFFPVHPRTKKQIETFGCGQYLNWVDNGGANIRLNNDGNLFGLPPLGYLDFMSLTKNSSLVFTDSGGLQEETTILGIPCITLRENTERPVTIVEGTNTLTGNNPEKIFSAYHDIKQNSRAPKKVPELWDGRTAERIVNILVERYWD
jgi:UDP-N-acetylglucosamine 2-epimerase (non-hydrolysing)